MTSREHFVYRLFDSEGHLLYIGCTKRIDRRWSEHRATRPGMVAATVHCKLQGPFTRAVALEIERSAIRAEEPLVGWTPSRSREVRKRDRWIEQRIAALRDAGMSIDEAVPRALADADEQFPDPDAHQHLYRGTAA